MPFFLAYVIFFVYLCSRKGLGTNDASFVESIVAKNMSEREFESKVQEGLKITYRKVVEQHRRDNQPLIFSENGQVQFVDPHTVQI